MKVSGLEKTQFLQARTVEDPNHLPPDFDEAQSLQVLQHTIYVDDRQTLRIGDVPLCEGEGVEAEAADTHPVHTCAEFADEMSDPLIR